ncbi:MAG: hypothetical protein H0W48_00015 [Methylibium sp.]|nr:hypothetical protein [Methylibium sp.]
MKTLLISAVLLLAGGAAAQEAMHAECVRQMQGGFCALLEPVESYSEEELARTVRLAGIGAVTKRDFLSVRGLATPDLTDTRMCDVARDACRVSREHPHCMVGRSLWGD